MKKVYGYEKVGEEVKDLLAEGYERLSTVPGQSHDSIVRSGRDLQFADGSFAGTYPQANNIRLVNDYYCLLSPHGGRMFFAKKNSR